MYKTLVLGGGGFKGIGLLGSLQCLLENGILSNIQEYIGVSVGALIGLLLIIGYQPKTLIEICLGLDFSKLSSIKLENINNFGLDDGDGVKSLVRTMLTKKGFNSDITLTTLYDKTGIDFSIGVTCLTKREFQMINHKTHPNLSIIKAIRMTTSLPMYFTPVFHNGEYYIDGGLLNNYPMSVCNSQTSLGILLTSNTARRDIKTIQSYLSEIASCIHKRDNEINTLGFSDRTIVLDLDISSIFEYDIDKQRRLDIIDLGYKKAKDFLSNRLPTH